MNGTIFDIKEMALHDGPGIRTTVFFKGCPLRCNWCHNPEGLSRVPQLMYRQATCRHCGSCAMPCNHPQCIPFGRCIRACPENCLEISGREMLAQNLAEEILPAAEFLGNDFGGFTFSGGEPMMQPEFLLELIGILKGYDLCIETSGFAPPTVFRQVIDRLDRVIMDIKIADSVLHKRYTGVDSAVIFENFKYLRASSKPYLIRTPLIPGITDTEQNLSQIRQLIGLSDWEQLPYNSLAGAKYKMLGMVYPFQEQQEKENFHADEQS